MKLGVNSLLSLLDVGTGFCYWLLGRDLLEDEVKRIQGLFVRGKHSVRLTGCQNLTTFSNDICFLLHLSSKARR